MTSGDFTVQIDIPKKAWENWINYSNFQHNFNDFPGHDFHKTFKDHFTDEVLLQLNKQQSILTNQKVEIACINFAYANR